MNKKKNKNKKGANNFLTVIAGVALGFVLVFAIISVDLISKMNLLPFGKDDPVNEPTGFVEVTESGEEKIAIDTLNELRGVNDLSTVLKSWAQNTTDTSLMRSEDVINVLLMGVDASGTNADTIIIASLNKTHKKIYLTSVFRDSYTYINTKYGDKYAKINACYANGGADKLIETIQNDFKIKIDYYVSVNFESFRSIVDTFGGINLDVQEYEAREIQREIRRECPFGENVHLDGEQALTFCRIRNCDVDADISRTRRQRQFINAIIDEAKNISINQISPLLNTVIKYVKTDCSVSEIISLGTQAISNKWYNYEIVSDAIPSDEHRLDYRGNAWVWIVDYPAAAKSLQEKIYGQSNIELSTDRVSAVDIMRDSGNSGNAAP